MVDKYVGQDPTKHSYEGELTKEQKTDIGSQYSGSEAEALQGGTEGAFEGDLTIEQQLQRQREKDTQARREMYLGGAEGVTAAAKRRAGVAAKGGAQAKKDIERGVAEGLAASAQTDIRSLSGAASEARAKGAAQILETEMFAEQAAAEAAAAEMDQAVAMQEQGSAAEDFAIMNEEFDEEMRAIIERNKGADDDEDAMALEIYAMVQHLPPDHALRLKYESRADDIKEDRWDP